MSSIEAKFILEDGGRMRPISKTILYFLLDYELILVDIGNDGWWIEMWQVDDELHLCVDVDDPLLLFALANLQVDGHVVVLGKFQVQWQGFVDCRDVDVMVASVSKTKIKVLLSSLEIDLMELVELFRFEDGFVDGDREGEVVEDKHSWDYSESKQRDAGFCGVLGFFFGRMFFAFTDVVEFIDYLLIFGLLFEVSQLRKFLCDLIDDFLMDHKFDLTFVCIIWDGKQEQSNGLLFLIFRL